MDVAPLLQRKLVDVSWVAFDTEATGFSNVSARLVEIAGVRFRLKPGPVAVGEACPIELEDSFAELVDPGIPIPDEVVKIHGITNAEVAGRARPVDGVERFCAFVADSVLIAHYVPFDLGAMTYALLRVGKGVPRIAALDTSLLPKRLFPGARNYALPTLVQFLGLPQANAHRALPDALSTMELFRRCVAAIGPAELTSVEDVTKLAGPLLTFDQFSEIPYELPPDLMGIGDAIAQQADLTVEYRGGSKGQGARRVTPSHLFAREGTLFLEGYCHLDQAPKSFRIDRIEKVTVLPIDPAAPVLWNKGSGHWVKEARDTGAAL
jgi:DNA polymerase III epsilon subunit-like protein